MSDLPFQLLDHSVRVSGEGDVPVKILDVQVETVHTAEIQDRETKRLQAAIDSLRSEKQAAADRIAVLEAQKEFIGSLQAESTRDINKNILVTKPTTQDWQNILQFVGSNLARIYGDIQRGKDLQNKIDLEIRALEQKINQVRSDYSRGYKQIRINLFATQPGDAKVEVSYLVRDAAWRPSYEVRVVLGKAKAEISFYASVQQATGEEWKDVLLTLSTARPLTTPSLPSLQQLYLDAQRPIQYDRTTARVATEG
jgi:uncharacterized protein (TIGR02231 family)